MGNEKKIPTSRVGRTTRLGTLAAGQIARQAGTYAANMMRDDQAAQEALAKRQLESAKQIVAVLGTMKGAAMKLGQVLSVLDIGLVPEQYREEFQSELAKLRDTAPKVSFDQMRAVIERDLGQQLETAFKDFQAEPIAAASIGQVYRATLHDDREVAVKVQYPGIAEAVRSDLKNLGWILRIMQSVAPGIDAKSLAAEIRERISEELDYELELQNQRSLARIFARHPFIVIPDVMSELSSEHVIVSEYVAGKSFEEIKQLTSKERDRVGEIIFRFFFGSLYRHAQFSGDPHPGNFLLLSDGRVAFLDFGLFKRMDRAAVELELSIQRTTASGDAEGLFQLLLDESLIKESDRKLFTPEDILQQLLDFTWWYTLDGEVELTQAIATKVAIEMSDPRSSHFEQMRHQTLPPEHLLARRMETLTLAVLGQLGAKANWHQIAREWVFNDPPTTELGQQEAKFYGLGPTTG